MNSQNKEVVKLPEPAKVLVHQISSGDVLEVLRKHSLQVANSAGRPFDAIAEELFDDLDFYRLERAALLAGDQQSAQSTAIRDAIADQLVEHGVLKRKLPPATLEQARAALISEWKWASDNSRDVWQTAAKTILDRILKNTPAGALILLKADLEKASPTGVAIYYERAVKSVQALVDMPGESQQTPEPRWFIGALKERNGEQEYSHKVLLQVCGSPEDSLRDVASSFYDDEGDPSDDGFFHNGGTLFVEPASITAVTAGEAEILRKVMPVYWDDEALAWKQPVADGKLPEAPGTHGSRAGDGSTHAISREVHKRLFARYLGNLTLADARALFEGIEGLWREQANGNMGSQLKAHDAQVQAVSVVVDHMWAHDLSYIDGILAEEGIATVPIAAKSSSPSFGL